MNQKIHVFGFFKSECIEENQPQLDSMKAKAFEGPTQDSTYESEPNIFENKSQKKSLSDLLNEASSNEPYIYNDKFDNTPYYNYELKIENNALIITQNFYYNWACYGNTERKEISTVGLIELTSIDATVTINLKSAFDNNLNMEKETKINLNN